jgi:DNA-binding transcriptional LysR family regulator
MGIIVTSWDGIAEAVAVDGAGTFAAAARMLNVSTSHVSRAVARLEESLQVQIFNRTTRRVVATEDGRQLLNQLRRIVDERDQAFASVAVGGEPQGELKLTCSVALGDRFVVPIVRQFAADYPDISVTIDLTNRIVDMVAEGYDIAIRTGDLHDSRLIATRIGSRRMQVCAAPSYLEGRPPVGAIADLDTHACLIGTNANWGFAMNGAEVAHRVKGRWHCNSGESTAEAAIAGMGVCQLPDFHVRKAIRDGRLVTLLEKFEPSAQPIWAVYPQRRHLLPKVRVLVDRLKAELQSRLGRD